jgi:hypothetical protein
LKSTLAGLGLWLETAADDPGLSIRSPMSGPSFRDRRSTLIIPFGGCGPMGQSACWRESPAGSAMRW